MIKQYGADAIRWFILSDSPPEKDVQWSDTGVASAHKFLQRVWNLNHLISKKITKSSDKTKENDFKIKINEYVRKIDNSINTFRFNVSIAYFYEIYKIFKDYSETEINSKTLKDNLINIMKLMIPFTPHLAYECLELLKCNTVNNWPEINQKLKIEDLKLAVQVNGKTRDIINIKMNMSQKEVGQIILKHSKAKKFINNKKIIRIIFVKNKIINYIIQN